MAPKKPGKNIYSCCNNKKANKIISSSKIIWRRRLLNNDDDISKNMQMCRYANVFVTCQL
jgi:hypothetical protein